MIEMTDVAIPNKKLKQTRLSFPKLASEFSEEKENLHQKSKGAARKCSKNNLVLNENCIVDSETNFKSLSKKHNELSGMERSNVIEVKVDVHATIQCPEVSTSSIHSESDEEDDTEMKQCKVIDLTDTNDANENTKVTSHRKLEGSAAEEENMSKDSVNFSVSKDVEQSYDDAITAAIKRSLDDPEGLLQSMACKKRKRSSSFARADAVDSDAKEPTSPDTSCNDSPDSSGTPTVTFSSAAVNESKVNTPSKRSIRSMFQAVARKSAAPPTPSSSQSAGDSAGKPEEVTTLKSGVDLQNADLNESRNTGEDGTNSQLSTDRCDDGAGLPTKGNDENNVSDVAKRPRNSDHIPASLEEANPSNGAPVATGDQLHPAIEAVLEDEVNQVCAEKATADENDVKIVSVDLGDRKSPTASKPKRARKLNPEMQRRKEQEEKEKEEKRRLKEQARLAKEQEKVEIKRKKEEERAAREEEKRKKKEELDRVKEEKLKKKQEEQDKKKAEQEAKRLEREQKDLERQREKEKRDEEKRLKEEEKQKFLEEKQRADEEQKRISQRQASAFKNYFYTSPARSTVEKKVLRKSFGDFVQFQLKEDMVLSPSHRRVMPPSASSDLDRMLQQQENTPTYLDELKPRYRSRRSSATLPKKQKKLLSLSEDGLELVTTDDKAPSAKEILRAKLLQFSENNRPPYYGTWRKKTAKLKAKNPFKKDQDIFDYEIDSDDEWEDPGEGEDIVNSEGEEDKEDDDEDECDGFFVPHGYLSDDEGIDADGEVNEDLSEQKLKMKQQEFENSFKQKLKVLAPVSIGCVWPDVVDSFAKSSVMTLRNYEMTFFVPAPISLEAQATPSSDKTSDSAKNKRQPGKIPEEAIPDLVRMLHGNPLSAQKLVKEFQVYWELKNTQKLGPKQGPLPPEESPDAQTENAMEVETGSADREVSELLSGSSSNNMDVGPSPSISPCTSKPNSPDPSKLRGVDVQPASGITGVVISTPIDKGPHWIAKSQIMKKIKEIGVYGRKDNLSRSCWFVLDTAFETYSLDRALYPLPCRWGYVTAVPDLKIYDVSTSAAPQAAASAAAESPKEAVTSSARNSIEKFTAKVSSATLFEESLLKEKVEKERQAQLASTAAISGEQLQSINKYATAKMSPVALIDVSSQRLTNQAPRRIELAPVPTTESQPWLNESSDCSQSCSGGFGVPTHAAFKSFFKMDQLQNNTPDQTTASPQTNDAESKDATEDVAVKEVKNTDAPMES